MSDNYYDVILEKCEIFEEVVLNELDRDKFVKPDYYKNLVFYYLILVWRHYLWNIELVFQACNRKEYQFLSAFTHEEKKTNSPWIEDDQLYLGKIVQEFAQMKKYNFIALDGTKKNIIRKNDNHKSLLKKCYYLILYMVYWFIIKFFLKNKVIFVTNLAYNMNQLCLDLGKKIIKH